MNAKKEKEKVFHILKANKDKYIKKVARVDGFLVLTH